MTFFIPSSQELHPININLFNEGEWALEYPFEAYIDGPVSLKTFILKDSANEKFIRLRAINSANTYSGVTFYIAKPVPENANLTLKWRGSGHSSAIIIDVMDGSKVDSLGKGDSAVVWGRNFFLECKAPENQWNNLSFPLDTLTLNPNQPSGKTLDRDFNYGKIRQVSISICPGSDFTLDIKNLYFSWMIEKWTVITVLFLISFVGFLLLIRTKRERLLLENGTTLNLNALMSRITFCLVSLSAAVLVFLKSSSIVNSTNLAVYAALFLLILVDEFFVFQKSNSLWSLRYTVVLFTGYLMGFSGGILPVCLILMASYMPLIMSKSRVLFWMAVFASLIGYVAEPRLDSHFQFFTGLIMIICSSVIAGILRAYLQQQHKDFILEQAILQYEALFKRTSDAIYILNEKGVIVTGNRSFEQLTGYDLNELKGQSILRFVGKESEEKIEQMLTAIDDNEARQYDIYFVQKNGQTRTALVRCSAIYKEKQINGYQALATDITERKAAEEKLEETIKLMEYKAAELEELNEQLRLSEDKLKELNVSKDKFFSIISHDLKNPFYSLLGLSDLLVTDCDNLNGEEIKVFAININETVKRLYNLLSNLLQWAIIQSGKLKYEPGCIKLYEAAEGTIGILEANIAEKNIKVINNIDEDILIYADLNTVNSILQNLITNGIKFTNAGGIISLFSEKIDNMVAVTVKDTGIGMSSEVMDKLFRIDTHHTTRGTAEEAGTGLGLILCKEMVEHNGGTIHVESEPGKGSSFIFTLPEFHACPRKEPSDFSS